MRELKVHTHLKTLNFTLYDTNKYTCSLLVSLPEVFNTIEKSLPHRLNDQGSLDAPVVVCTMILENALNDLLKSIGLREYNTYKYAFERKVEHNGLIFRNGRHLNDEKTYQVHVLMESNVITSDEKKYLHFSLLLTSSSPSRLLSLLLSPCGEYLAIISQYAVYVIDAIIQSDNSKQQETQLVRPLYCALDTNDFNTPSNFSNEIIRVRWHPKFTQTMVILTENSSLYFIQCSKLNDTRSIQFYVRFETYLNKHTHSALGAVYDDMESLSETSEYESESEDQLGISHNKLNVNLVLGTNCVDFDFGSPRLSNRPGMPEVKSQDCCLFILYETGDIVEVSGCLSNQKSAHVKINAVKILPPSIDNYGDNFCSIVCLPAPNYGELMLFEKPPDVLILADKFGRLHNGIVLRTTAPEYNRDRNLNLGPSTLLCLVDIVDLQIGTCVQQSDDDRNELVVNSSINHKTNSLTFDSYRPLLCLIRAESSFLNYPLYNMEYDLKLLNYKQGYYAIHDTGVHFISLSWMRYLSDWCSEFADNPLHVDERNSKADIRNWRSGVKHLVCGQVDVIEPNSASDSVGKFRLSGFIEYKNTLNFDDLLSTNKLNEESKRFQSRSVNSTTLLIVQAPISNLNSSFEKPDSSCVVQTIHLTLKPSCWIRQLNKLPNALSPLNKSLQKSPSDSIKDCTTNRSELANHIRHLFSAEDLHFPVITGLNTQSGLTQHHLVKFIIEITTTLHNGPLARLSSARAFIERQTHHFGDVITAQYAEASKLASKRQTLQTKAESLAKKQALINERQTMLDKRLANLATRLASLGEGPTKAEVAMHDEVKMIQERLTKGLKKWLENLKTRQNKLNNIYELQIKEQKKSNIDYDSINLQNKCKSNLLHDPNQWTQSISEKLKCETNEIKILMDLVKSLNVKTDNKLN